MVASLRQRATQNRMVASLTQRATGSGVWYGELCRRHPFAANVLVIGGLAVVGDSIMQHLEGERDAIRLARFTAFRVGYTAPFYTVWYRLLSLAVPASLPIASAAVIKTCADCFISTPLQHMALFSSQAVFEGRAHEALDRCATMMPRSLPASWCFWGPCQLITFSCVPAHLRVTFINLVSLSWNVVLSGLTSQARGVTASAA